MLLVLVWGSTWAAIRVAAQHMPILRSVALRFVIASVLLVAVMLWNRVKFPTAPEWRLLAFFACFTVVMPFSMVAWASNRMSSSLTSILFASSPLLVAVMEPLFMRGIRDTPLTWPVILGLVGGMAGISVVLLGAFQQTEVRIEGVAVVLFVVVFGAVASILAKQRLSNIPPLTVTTCTTLIAAVVLSVSSLLLEHDQPTHWDTAAVSALLFLGVCSSALGSFLFYWLLIQLRPHQLAARYFLMPIVALGEGRYLLGETITPAMLGGMLLVLTSIVPVLRRPQMATPVSAADAHD